MSSDPVYNWLLSLNADSKYIHTPQDRVKFLCRYFKVISPAGNKQLAKKILSSLRPAIEAGEHIDADRFVALALSSIQAKKKWDLEAIVFARSKGFYQSRRWKAARVEVLARQNKCKACGASPDDGAVLHVDHILPRSIYPEYALCQTNLQVLCADCNIGKSNTLTKRF